MPARSRSRAVHVPSTASGAAHAATANPDEAARPTWASANDQLRHYYDHEWGVPVTDERGLYEALSLEVFQSGLSWSTILRKRPAFRNAFADFRPDVVAGFGQADVERLMADEGIVRNRMKIDATIQNARATVALRAEGGLVRFVWSFAPENHDVAVGAASVGRTAESEALARGLKLHGFKFVGPTTMYALMQATGVVKVKPVHGA